MQYGLSLPTGRECGDPLFLVDLAVRAESAGWDGVFLEDYVWYEGDPAAPTCNTWVALAAMAVQTERIRLGTSVTPLPRRRPWNVAREAAAVDQLSGGRMVLGVGLGDTGESIGADPSFVRVGEERDPKRRGRILDECLEIVAGLWTGEPFSFHGEHFTVDEVTFAPPPVQRPRIPIWVAGRAPNARPLARAREWDGYVPIANPPLSPTDLASYVGPHPHDGWDLVAQWTPGFSADEFAAAGATWLVRSVWPNEEGWLDELEAMVDAAPA